MPAAFYRMYLSLVVLLAEDPDAGDHLNNVFVFSCAAGGGSGCRRPAPDDRLQSAQSQPVLSARRHHRHTQRKLRQIQHHSLQPYGKQRDRETERERIQSIN